MGRLCKLTPDITQQIRDNISLGLPYTLATEFAGIKYQTFNDLMNKGKNSNSEEYSQIF
jgi:hypothetical protein